eukprot:3659000-Prymnesium_polylepis.1
MSNVDLRTPTHTTRHQDAAAPAPWPPVAVRARFRLINGQHGVPTVGRMESLGKTVEPGQLHRSDSGSPAPPTAAHCRTARRPQSYTVRMWIPASAT